jgi:hypothetical protein
MGIWIGAVATLLLEGSSSFRSAVAGDAIATTISIDKNRFRMISPWRRRANPLIGRSFVGFLQLIENKGWRNTPAAPRSLLLTSISRRKFLR